METDVNLTAERESAVTIDSGAGIVRLKSSEKTQQIEGENSKEAIKQEFPHLLSSTDKQTTFSRPGFRALYSLFSWGVMGYKVESGRSFFIIIFLFMLSICFDYAKFNPKTPFRKWIRKLGIIWGLAWVFVAFMGTVGALNVVINKPGNLVIVISNFAIFNGFNIRFWIVYILLGLTIILTLLDWISEKSELEQLITK